MTHSRVLLTFVTLSCPSEFGEMNVLTSPSSPSRWKIFLRWVSCSAEPATWCAHHDVHIFSTPLLIRRFSIGRFFAFSSLNSNAFWTARGVKLCCKISVWKSRVLIDFPKTCASPTALLASEVELKSECTHSSCL